MSEPLRSAYPKIQKSLISDFAALPIGKPLISESQLDKPIPRSENLTDLLVRRLSFTHFIELMKCHDPQQPQGVLRGLGYV